MIITKEILDKFNSFYRIVSVSSPSQYVEINNHKYQILFTDYEVDYKKKESGRSLYLLDLSTDHIQSTHTLILMYKTFELDGDQMINETSIPLNNLKLRFYGETEIEVKQLKFLD